MRFHTTPVQPRIALVVPRFPAESETFIVNKFLGLLERGLDVHVVANKIEMGLLPRFPALATNRQARRRLHAFWPTGPKWLVPFLAPMAALDLCAHRAGSAFLRYLRKHRSERTVDRLKAWYIDAALAALHPDIVHYEFGALGVGRTHVKQLLNAKVTVSIRGHDISFVRLDQKDYYMDVWKNADRVHFLGSDLLQRARKRGFPSHVPYDLIPPGIDTKLFSPDPVKACGQCLRNKRPVRILSVGRLHWAKGYEYALQALALLKASGASFTARIIGGGAHEAAVRYTRDDLGLEREVTLLGVLTHDQVIEEMRAADIFLHASVSEGFCNAVLEAQAMSLPVVCSDADGLAENVRNEVTGFVVPRRDPQALTASLLKLIADPALRLRMGAVGRERVEREYSLETNISRFVAFYEKAMAGGDR